jgi:hypothetical protein
MPRPEGYETPRTPPATPPVIDPDAEPKSAEEMEADGEREGEVQGHRSDPEQIDTELSETLKQRQARDGAGEEELDAMTPETLLPPD